MIKKILTISALFLTLVTSAYSKELPDFTELAEKQGPSVVNISVTQVMQQNENPFPGMPDDEAFGELFRRFGLPMPGVPRGQTPPQEFKSQSLGSGFIISADGYILTNAHVVNSADEVIVKLSDKREFKAKIIGADRRTDVALLKIDANGLPKVNIGDPNQLKVGEWVAAIGSPFGLENTMTAGIVSAKGRALPQENFVPFIQTDVAINPGNSGGALVDVQGNLVGINTAIYSRSGGNMGIGFAIPVSTARQVLEGIVKDGQVVRGWLGIEPLEITPELAETFSLKQTEGVIVTGVLQGGPAAKAGIKPGDIVTRVAGQDIGNVSELLTRIAALLAE